MQDQVHLGEASGAAVLLLTVERDLHASFIGDFDQKGARPASRVVNGSCASSVWAPDAHYLRHDPADFGWRIELPLRLAALRREMAHQEFVGVTQDIVAVCPVPGEEIGRASCRERVCQYV